MCIRDRLCPHQILLTTELFELSISSLFCRSFYIVGTLAVSYTHLYVYKRQGFVSHRCTLLRCTSLTYQTFWNFYFIVTFLHFHVITVVFYTSLLLFTKLWGRACVLTCAGPPTLFHCDCLVWWVGLNCSVLFDELFRTGRALARVVVYYTVFSHPGHVIPPSPLTAPGLSTSKRLEARTAW